MIVEPTPTAGVLKDYGLSPLNVYDTIKGRDQIYDKTKNFSTEEMFTITFINNETKKKEYFNFALLPAIETNASKGQGGVPEVKPGVITMTNMKYKNFIIPGATPVVQSIGVQNTVHQFVGAFIGSETITAQPQRPSLSHIYRTGDYTQETAPWTTQESSFNKAKRFDHYVVQSCRPITLKMVSDITYTYEGVVTSFKFYTVRADRAYYIIDVLATVYPTQLPPAAPKPIEETKTNEDSAKNTDSKPRKEENPTQSNVKIEENPTQSTASIEEDLRPSRNLNSATADEKPAQSIVQPYRPY